MKEIEQKWAAESKQDAATRKQAQKSKALVERESVQTYGRVLDKLNDVTDGRLLKRHEKECAYRDDLKKQIIQRRQNDYIEQTKLSSVEYNVNKKHAERASTSFYNQTRSEFNHQID